MMPAGLPSRMGRQRRLRLWQRVPSLRARVPQLACIDSGIDSGIVVFWSEAVLRPILSLLFISLLCAAGAASAGSFSIDPVRIQLSEAKPSAVMRVENRGDASITVQLQSMSWSQAGNQDQLAVSRELLATPQIFRLRPGQVQVVRIALLGTVDATRERAYRLLLDEIPPPPAAEFRGLQMALRISMPVFVQARAPAAASLAATVVERDGQRQLQLTNRGHAHLQLTGLQLQAQPAATSTTSATPTLYSHDKTLYVLPGQQRELPLPGQFPLAAGQVLNLQAQTDSGAQEWPVPAVRALPAVPAVPAVQD